jgi:16S rRNA (cytosine967-C5)-methyltransferase
MAGQKFKSARAVAVEVLKRWDPKKNYAGSILDELQQETEQKQRATDLVFGTLRNCTAIDTVIAKFSGRPVERIQNSLLNIIRIGTYELVYCPSTEQYAIVNEAVVNAGATGGAKQSGFVNAVLRQITRHISNRQVSLTKGDAGSTLPQTPTTGCQFDTSFLPDCQASQAEYLSAAFSLPEWLVAGWLAEYGEESTRQICFASNRRPSVYLRPNPLKTTTEALAEKFRDTGVDLEVDSEDSMIRIISPHAISQLPGFAEGEFSVQDISASKPVRILNPQPGWKILDLCAAPGTKTTQLAEATGDSASIIATDIDSRRIKMVSENIARLGINSVDVIPYGEVIREPTQPADERQSDGILLDVPCSNTGVLAKRIEVRYRIKPETIGELTGLQAKLLRTASDLVRPGGKICYSTCSIQKAENSELVDNFLRENQNFTLESEQLMLPTAERFDHDGGYTAILAKRQSR